MTLFCKSDGPTPDRDLVADYDSSALYELDVSLEYMYFLSYNRSG